ncbi:MAG: M56 family metallopeptidase, partial [Bacteroidales bacterium]|nr:M56 family metallopeptidase [Bacteroidales bacterium]
MIESIMLYLVKVALGSTVLLCCYCLLFRNETFHFRNRMFLLLSLLIPLVIPIISIAPAIGVTEVQRDVIDSGVIISTSHAVETGISNTIERITFIEVLFYIYLAGLLFILSRIVKGIFTINRIKRKSKQAFYQDIPLVLMKQDLVPFTFLDKIFISEKLYREKDCNDILWHESIHVRQRHFLDLFISELFLAFQWFNPSAWIIRKAIRENHEYMADNYAKDKTESLERYQLSLLGIHGLEKALPLANNFNHSIIKKRIIMMNKSKTRRGALLKTLLAIPIVALIFISLVANSGALHIAQPASELDDQVDSTLSDEITQEKEEFSDVSKRKIKGPFYHIMYPEEAISNNYEHDFYLVIKTEDGRIIEKGTFLSPDQFSAPVIDQLSIVAFRSGPEAKMSTNTVKALDNMMYERSIDAAQKINQLDIPELEGKTMEFALKISYDLLDEDMKDKPFVVVQSMPSFNGGDIDKFKKWVQDRISYPDELKGQGIEGKVFIMFIVDKDGSVNNTSVMRSLHPQLDKIAVDVINSSPRWQPGHLNSEDPVKVRFSVA